MQYDLNRLRFFYHIYSLGSVSLAASKLNLSQPAVSQHLQKLEKELKVLLFTRVHKKLVPTSAGSRLFQEIAPFLSGLPEKLQTLRYPADSIYGHIRLGAPDEFGKEYMPEICFWFHQLHPDVRFSILLGEPLGILNLLKNGEIDFGVIDLVLATVQLAGHGDIYNIESLIDEELTLICSKQYYDEHINGDHSYTTLMAQDYISDEHDHMFISHWFAHHFEKSGAVPNVVMMVESHQANLACVKMGMGLTVTSSHMVWEEIEAGTIVPVMTNKKNAINSISLLQLQDKVPTLTEKAFYGHIVESMQKDCIRRKFNL